jgi:hypothetical protein
MGIRIKKIMGYSLSLKDVAEQVCAPNMSWDNWEFREDEGRWQAMCDEILSYEYSAHGHKDPFILERMYLEMIRDNPDRADSSDYSLNRLKRGSLGEYVTYNSEFGCKDTVLFQPMLASKDWYRFDDSIDYVEAHLQGETAGPKVVRHNRALYPFTNLMRKNPDSFLGIEEYWESCYLDSPKHKDAVPTCTYGVMMLLKYLNMVPEDKLPDAIMLMRPTIYTYWS